MKLAPNHQPAAAVCGSLNLMLFGLGPTFGTCRQNMDNQIRCAANKLCHGADSLVAVFKLEMPSIKHSRRRKRGGAENSFSHRLACVVDKTSMARKSFHFTKSSFSLENSVKSQDKHLNKYFLTNNFISSEMTNVVTDWVSRIC